MILGLDGQPLQPVPNITYADETHGRGIRPSDARPLFLAQVDDVCETNWLAELRRLLGRPEVKWRDWVSCWRHMEPRLRQAIRANTQHADIFIADSQPAFAEIRQFVSRDLNREEVARSRPIRDFIRVWGSRLFLLKGAQERVASLLTLCDLTGGWDVSVYAQFSERWDSRKLAEKLRHKKQSIELYVARSHAAFSEILKPINSLDRLEYGGPPYRYYSPHTAVAELLGDALVPTRVFDEGNSRVVGTIRDLRRQTAAELEHLCPTVMWGLRDNPGPVRSERSESLEHLQVADVAAGYAAYLWEGGGLEAVVNHFRGVSINGRVIH